MIRALVLALVVCVGAPAFAQAPGQTPPVPRPGAGVRPLPPPPRETRRERIKKRIRALRAYTLTEELGLDDTTAGKMFPVLARYDDQVELLLSQRAELQRKLDGAGALKDTRAIDRIIDDAVANQRAFFDLEDRRLGELRKILTPAQTARLLIVLPALERKIQNQLQRAIQKAARPARDDDDDVEPNERPRSKSKPCDPFSDTHGCSR